MNDPLSYLMNAHEWYTLDTTADHIRAWLWVVANLTTWLSYFLIPLEIWRWRALLPFPIASTIGILFILFIALCGTSHFVMVIIMPTAPWWATLLVYGPMAIVSLATYLVCRSYRHRLKGLFTGAKKVLGAPAP